MKEYVNEHELRVVGMSRSGNHAILHWICAQAPGRWCFLNCAEPGQNPFLSARPLGNAERGMTGSGKLELDREARGDFSAKDWLIYSYEDCFLKMVCAIDERHDQLLGTSRHRQNVLILRDPFNLFASRLESGVSGVTLKTSVRIWKQHARQFLDRQRLLPDPVVPINYNRWVGSRAYRRTIASRLGLPFTDAGAERVCTTAGGSSFDGVQYCGRASRMPVTERWRKYEADPEFRVLFDKQVVELSNAIFGRLPGMDEFLLQGQGLSRGPCLSQD